MNPATIAAVLGGLFGGKGGSGGGTQQTSVNVSQNNSQTQAVNIGSSAPALTGSPNDLLSGLYNDILGVSSPTGMSVGDSRYITPSASNAVSGINWNTIFVYVLIGLAAYYIFLKLRH